MTGEIARWQALARRGRVIPGQPHDGGCWLWREAVHFDGGTSVSSIPRPANSLGSRDTAKTSDPTKSSPIKMNQCIVKRPLGRGGRRETSYAVRTGECQRGARS